MLEFFWFWSEVPVKLLIFLRFWSKVPAENLRLRKFCLGGGGVEVQRAGGGLPEAPRQEIIHSYRYCFIKLVDFKGCQNLVFQEGSEGPWAPGGPRAGNH